MMGAADVCHTRRGGGQTACLRRHEDVGTVWQQQQLLVCDNRSEHDVQHDVFWAAVATTNTAAVMGTQGAYCSLPGGIPASASAIEPWPAGSDGCPQR